MSTRRLTMRRRSVSSVSKPSRSSPERRCSRPASACAKNHQPDGAALAGDRSGDGTVQTESAAAGDGTRILGGTGDQPVARGAPLDEGRVLPSTAPRATSRRRNPLRYYTDPTAPAPA